MINSNANTSGNRKANYVGDLAPDEWKVSNGRNTTLRYRKSYTSLPSDSRSSEQVKESSSTVSQDKARTKRNRRLGDHKHGSSISLYVPGLS